MSFLKKQSVLNVLLCLSFILITGLFKIFYPSELYWDLVNYHYYNAWAFIYHRLGYDIAPAMINTYFNPLLDVPYYLLLNVFPHMPSVVIFIQGAWGGLLLFVFYKICLLFFDTKKEWLALFITLVVAATGFSYLSQIGICSNEIQISILILWGFYLLLKHINDVSRQKKIMLFSGLLMGAALGLKPTVVSYCVATGISLILFSRPLKISFKEIVVFTLGGLSGYLLTNGWWMCQLYAHFDNPFFPFLNGIFQSDYFESTNFYDSNFIEKTSFFEKLWLPILMFFQSQKSLYVSTSYFFDWRFTISYIVMMIIFIKWLMKNRKFTDRRNLLLYAFIGFSYLIWVYLFSIIRYVVPLEMLLAIVIVRFFSKIQAKTLLGTIFLLSFDIIGIFALVSEAPEYLKYHSLKRNNFADLFAPIEQSINLPENALIETYGYPSAMIAARIVGDKPNRIISFANYLTGANIDFIEMKKLHQIRDKVKKEHNGPNIAIIASNYFSRTSVEAKVFASYAHRRQLALEKEGMYCRLFLLMDKIIVCVPDEIKQKIFVNDKKVN